jgi:dTDP-glucose 4,6-dehydratase
MASGPVKKILVTGGAGFIGSNFVRWVIEHRHAKVIVLDALTYAGNLANLDGLDPAWLEFRRGDIEKPEDVEAALGDGVDAIVHFAAESHVDRSIMNPRVFFTTNVLGTQVLLEAIRARGGRFVHISTDEVYGSLGPHDPAFTEQHPLLPNSPYAASKAGSDLLVRSYVETFHVDAVITRCSNNYGPYQFPEKLIPLFITNALTGEPLPLYGDGMNVRDWIHAEDHSRAVWAVLLGGRRGEVYNIGGRNEWTNRDITEQILTITGASPSLVKPVMDRPGHDRRYAMDPSKIEQELGWKAEIPFQEGLRATVDWYRSHTDWWRAVKSGAYRDYYTAQYSERLR